MPEANQIPDANELLEQLNSFADKESAARNQAQQEDRILRQVFKSPMGKLALEILEREFLDRSAYQRGDPHHTAYKCGQADVVGFIKESIQGAKQQ